MEPDRRSVLALGLAAPLIAAAPAPPTSAPPPIDPLPLWRTLFAGPPGETIAWWYQGALYAHVDRLREFPVAGLHAIMIARTTTSAGGGLAVDFRTIGCFADLDSDLPTDRWDNVFTDRRQDIPPFFVEGPGRYVATPGAPLAFTAERVRTNRIVATAEIVGDRAMLTQIEGTLQGFPGLDGALPAPGGPAITERQTRLQLIAPRTVALGGSPAAGTRGFFSHVYDALPPWLGFGETLGSGLSKGQMRKAGAGEIVDRTAWAYLRAHIPSAFAGDRLVLA